MLRFRVMAVMGFLGLLLAGPAMAWDFGVNLNFGRDCGYSRPVVVRDYVPATRVVVAPRPVVVERSCYPVVVSRPRVEVRYVSPYRYYESHYVVRPHGERVIVRGHH